jgi:hypothetical protein
MVDRPDVSSRLAAILAEEDIGVTVISINAADRAPRETKAVNTLERMLRTHGPDHVRMVLSLIVQSENNARELAGPTIKAVSRELLAHPEWDDITGWFEELDAMPLAAIRRFHLGDLAATPIGAALSANLYARLARRFGRPVPQLDLFGGNP